MSAFTRQSDGVWPFPPAPARGPWRAASLLFLLVALSPGAWAGTSWRPSAAGAKTANATASYVINIQNYIFSPTTLTVPPGATVTVNNLDGFAHSVTSESAPNVFTPGAVAGISFDTGSFTTGSRTFVIPANATLGTVVTYYCTIHTMMMGYGSITVSNAVTDGGTTDGGTTDGGTSSDGGTTDSGTIITDAGGSGGGGIPGPGVGSGGSTSDDKSGCSAAGGAPWVLLLVGSLAWIGLRRRTRRP